MQFAGNPDSIADALLKRRRELRLNLVGAQEVQRPEPPNKGGGTKNFEPGGLVIRRSDRKLQRCACLVPYAAVVAGDHAEGVMAWRKIGVKRLPAIADIPPVAIVTFEPEAELVLLGSYQAQRCVININVLDAR